MSWEEERVLLCRRREKNCSLFRLRAFLIPPSFSLLFVRTPICPRRDFCIVVVVSSPRFCVSSSVSELVHFLSPLVVLVLHVFVGHWGQLKSEHRSQEQLIKSASHVWATGNQVHNSFIGQFKNVVRFPVKCTWGLEFFIPDSVIPSPQVCLLFLGPKTLNLSFVAWCNLTYFQFRVASHHTLVCVCYVLLFPNTHNTDSDAISSPVFGGKKEK